jgi:hypothetical protein
MEVNRKICKECGKVNTLKDDICTNDACKTHLNEEGVNFDVRKVLSTLQYIKENQGTFVKKITAEDLKPISTPTEKVMGKICDDIQCGAFTRKINNDKVLSCDKCNRNISKLKEVEKPIYSMIELHFDQKPLIKLDFKDQQQIFFGRDNLNDQSMTVQTMISREHLRFFKKEGDLYIEDLSAFGTWLNDKKLEKGKPIKLDYKEKIRIFNLNVRLKLVE